MGLELDPDILAAVQRSSGALPPDAQVAIAKNSQSIGDAVDMAQSVAAYGSATSQVNYLNGLDPNQQRKAWKQATTPQQQLWVSAGYAAPAQPDRGLFSRAVHDVFGAPAGLAHEITQIPGIGTPIGEAGQALAGGAGDVANALGSGIRFTQHLYRTGQMENLEGAPGSNPLAHNPLANVVQGAFGWIVDAHDWGDAWNKTNVGDQTFDPNKDRDIQSSSGYDENTVALAKAAAGGDEFLTKFFKSLKDNGMDTKSIVDLETMVNDDHFKSVVQQYKDAKLSFGRSLVPQFLWDHAHGAATVLSGAGDAAFSFADPYLVLGKAAKLAKISKYIIKSPEEIDALLAKPAAQAWIKDVSSYLQREDYAGLANRHTQLNPVMDFLREKNIKSPEELRAAMVPQKPTDELSQVNQATQDAETHLRTLLEDVPHENGVPIIESGSDLERYVKDAYDQAGLTKVKSEEATARWMADNILANHIITGHGSAINHGVPLVPTLTSAGKAILDAKGALKNKIDVSKDVRFDVGADGAQSLSGRLLSGPINLTGRTFSRMVNLLPEAATLKPNDPNSVTQIHRYASMYLPTTESGASQQLGIQAQNTADAILNRWVLAGSDRGIKRAIYLDMLENTFRAAGIDQSHPIYQRYIGEMKDGVLRQKYSVGGNDAMLTDNGQATAAGLLDQHLTDEWSLPSFRDLAVAQHRNLVGQLLYGAVNNHAVDVIFGAAWKAAQLLRVGFPIRVSLEELAGTIAREGPINVAKAAIAGRTLKGAGAMEGPLSGIDPLKPLKASVAYIGNLDPVSSAFSRLLRELPEETQARIQTPGDLQAAVLAHRADTFLKSAVGKFPGVADLEQTIRNYEELFKNGLPSEISSQHGRMLGYQEQNVADLAVDGTREHRLDFTPRVKVKPNGEYRHYLAGHAGFMSAWMKQLDDIATSTNTQVILKNIGDSDEVLRHKVADFLQSPEYRDKWKSAERSYKVSDNRTVGVDATERDAALDWADHLITHVRQLLPDAKDAGEHADAIVHALLTTGHVPDMQTLMKVDLHLRPNQVVGPEFVQLPGGGAEGMIREFSNRGFHRIGRAIDYMSRQPMYIVAVHKADRDLRPVIEGMFGAGTPMSEDILHTLVKQRADAETLPYIHNPQIRSQMNILTQNLAPFQFAQEQFWKRWGRTFYQSPEAIREVALAHHALGATGITHQDSSGQEIFTYPATGYVQKVLAEGLTHMGFPASIPVVDSFTGQLKMVAPGLDRSFAPSFGPFVSIPMTMIDRHIKELQPLGEKILGSQSASHSLWEQMVPSSIARLINAGIANDAISPSYASAQMKAIQDLYATHNGLDPNANADEREEFMRRVKNFTRINMFGKALFGFGAPAAPQSAIGDTKFGQQLRTLANAGLNYSEAMQEMVRRNPDMYPYTVFMSHGAGSEPLPATTAAMDMLDGNRSFFKAFPKAGGYFLPTKTSDNKFSNEAYREQLNEGLRQRRSPDEFLNQLMYSQASGVYYDMRDQHLQDVKGLHGAAKQQLDNQYQTWKDQYLAEHPKFADMLQEATAKVNRARTLDDVQRALNDSRVPKTAQTDDIRGLLDQYTSFQGDLAQWHGMTSARASDMRQHLTAQFAHWAKNVWLPTHDGATDVYNSLLRHDLERTGA